MLNVNRAVLTHVDGVVYDRECLIVQGATENDDRATRHRSGKAETLCRTSGCEWWYDVDTDVRQDR